MKLDITSHPLPSKYSKYNPMYQKNGYQKVLF